MSILFESVSLTFRLKLLNYEKQQLWKSHNYNVCLPVNTKMTGRIFTTYGKYANNGMSWNTGFQFIILC